MAGLAGRSAATAKHSILQSNTSTLSPYMLCRKSSHSACSKRMTRRSGSNWSVMNRSLGPPICQYTSHVIVSALMTGASAPHSAEAAATIVM